MALVEVSIIPVGTGSTGLSEYIAHAIKVLSQRAEREGLKFSVGAMGTTIEGDIDVALAAIREMQEALFKLGCQRIITHIQIDDRRDKPETMNRKVKAVEEKVKQLQD
jgi:uncharacterized protein (TIGR00106 family)